MAKPIASQIDNAPESASAPTPEAPAPEPTPAPEPSVLVVEWSDENAVNPLAKWLDNIVLITNYRGPDEVQVNGTDWIRPGKRYFEKTKGMMDSRGGAGKVHLRATVTRTEHGRYILK